MSGETYGYASEVENLEDVLHYRTALGEMRDHLVAVDAEDAAQELEDLLLICATANVRISARLRRLRPLLHALNWWASADDSEATFREALAKYRGEEKQT